MSGTKTDAAPRADAKPAAPEQSDVEKAIGGAFQGSKDRASFAEALDKQGITLARATPADLTALRVEQDREPTRKFLDLGADELVAVDQFGDVHRLNPERPDAAAIEGRWNDGTVPAEVRPATTSITDARIRFASRHEPTPDRRRRDSLRTRLGAVHAMLEAGRQGDHRGTVAAVTLLAEIVGDHIGPDPAPDHLRAAQAAIASGDTEAARQALAAARKAILRDGDAAMADTPPSIEKVDAATQALNDGDRRAAMAAIDDALRGFEPAQGVSDTKDAQDRPAAAPAAPKT
jgi:hypothetical protein